MHVSMLQLAGCEVYNLDTASTRACGLEQKLLLSKSLQTSFYVWH